MATRVRTSQGRFTVFVRDDRLVGLIRELPVRTREEVDAAATDIQERASQLAPRDTGSLSASIYRTNGQDSDYSQRSSQAHSLNPYARITSEVTPSVALTLSGGQRSGYSVIVGVAVQHGLFQEFGTRYQAPQPFLTPAVEAIREQFREGMTTVADA